MYQSSRATLIGDEGPFRVVVLNLPSAVLHVLVILLLLHGCNVTTVMNHNVFSNGLRGPS